MRDELRVSSPETYLIPDGKILTPSAREYLQQRKIKVVKESASTQASASACSRQPVGICGQQEAKYVDYESGAYYMEKPEFMTHLFDNELVHKSHPRIILRGKLDSLQALVVCAQTSVAGAGGSHKLTDDLSDILNVLREMMRCDVMNEKFTNERIIGLTHAELRERSHDPMKFFQTKRMLLPDYSMGPIYAALNLIRTSVRETEIAAVQSYVSGRHAERNDIIEGLNRMSSAIHIMMCMFLAGQYK